MRKLGIDFKFKIINIYNIECIINIYIISIVYIYVTYLQYRYMYNISIIYYKYQINTLSFYLYFKRIILKIESYLVTILFFMFFNFCIKFTSHLKEYFYQIVINYSCTVDLIKNTYCKKEIIEMNLLLKKSNIFLTKLKQKKAK